MLYDHAVFVNAELCCNQSEESIGKLGLVYETPYDLTDMKHLGCVMRDEGREELDVTYALYRRKVKKKGPLDMSPKTGMIVAAVARHVGTGRTLVVSTDQWGLRLHTCNTMAGLRGKGGAVYEKHAGFSFQTGSLPNALNIDNFPNIFITPLEPYHHAIRYYFTRVQDGLPGQRMFSNREPWLQERVALACDDLPPPSPDPSEEIETLYTNTYGTLEKLAEHRCGDNLEDEDSLSLHSSFTSFGSGDSGPLPEGDTALVTEQSGEVPVPETEPSEVGSEAADVFVKVQYPLPPYLTGKWPLPTALPDRPLPSKKVCQTQQPDSPKKTCKDKKSVKSFHVKKSEPPKTSRGIKKVVPTEYSKIELGLLNRVPDDKTLKKGEAYLIQPPEGLDLRECSVESALGGAKNPVLGGGPVFRWFERPERLPWYCGAGEVSVAQEPVLPEQEKRKRMGTFFKLVNFPEQYTDFDGTPEDLLKAVQLKVECLRAHYNSIKHSECKSRTCNAKDPNSDIRMI